MPSPRRPRSLLLCLLLLACVPHTVTARAPEVVVTIVPVHSLVAGVTRGVTQPTLLLDGAASPHRHALRPTQARALESADLVVWVGEALETFLLRALSPKAERRVIGLMELAGVRVLATRGSEDFRHGHAGGHDHPAGPGHGDPHVWLDPRNARAIVDGVAAALAGLDPANAGRYAANAADMRARIAALDTELRAVLDPVTEVPFVVFHDAYQGFERHYGMRAEGAVTLNPQRAPGAARIRALRERIRGTGARCVFREPQFEPRLVETLIEGTGARGGVLDPIGQDLEPGPEAWFVLMRNLARDLRACLAPS